MAAIHLLIFLAAGQLDLGGIDDDDVVAGVEERGIGGLVLALKQPGGLRGHAAEGLALGVDDVPPAVDGLRGCDVSTHADGSLTPLALLMTANPNDTTSWRRRSRLGRTAAHWRWHLADVTGTAWTSVVMLPHRVPRNPIGRGQSRSRLSCTELSCEHVLQCAAVHAYGIADQSNGRQALSADP